MGENKIYAYDFLRQCDCESAMFGEATRYDSIDKQTLRETYAVLYANLSDTCDTEYGFAIIYKLDTSIDGNGVWSFDLERHHEYADDFTTHIAHRETYDWEDGDKYMLFRACLEMYELLEEIEELDKEEE